VLITSDPEGRDSASIDWLVRKYAITVLPSVASLKTLREGKEIIAAIKPMIGFGDPVFDRPVRRVASRRRGPSKNWMFALFVKAGSGQMLAYVHFANEPGRRSAAKLLTKDEAAERET
jgi:hypothetical protein